MTRGEWRAFLRDAMHGIDFDELFAQVVYEVAGNALTSRGITEITEEQLDYMMHGIRDTVHLPAIGEIRRELGISTQPSRSRRTWMDTKPLF